MTYTDEEIRHMAISVLKLPTERDTQSRIGASNLSNGCNRCLAFNLQGDDRSTPILDKAWMGRVLGTSFHGLIDTRISALVDYEGLEGDALALKRRQVELMTGLHPDAKPEVHTHIATLRGYGPVGGTIDLLLPGHLVDWKGSLRSKICLLIDYIEISAGRAPRFGRKHKYMQSFEMTGKVDEDGRPVYKKVADQLSEKEYASEMEKMAYKVAGYYGQATAYMGGSGTRRASLVFIARDGTGFFDNPEAARYDDETAIHDVYVLSFDFDQAYFDALIARAQSIYDHLEAGGVPSDFDSHPKCFACETLSKEEVPNIEVTFQQPVAA